MDAARKSFEIQAQVRHNAEEFKNSINDLYNWQKEIKEKERNLNNQPMDPIIPPTIQETTTMSQVHPIRSHVFEKKTNAATKQLANKTKIQVVKEKEPDYQAKAENTTTTTTETIEMKRKSANDIKDKGNKLVRLGDYKMASKEYTQAIELYPDEPIFYTNRAFCYLKMELYQECIEDCDRAINMDKSAVKAYYRRMLANEILGNNVIALKDCISVLDIEPSNAEAKRCLTRINDRLHKHSKKGPNFTALNENMVEILPIDKPPYQRSQKVLQRIPITDVIGPKDCKNYDNLKISDEDIDKIFNSNCGSFEEIKKNNSIDEKINDLPSSQQPINNATSTDQTTTTTITTTTTTTTTATITDSPTLLKQAKDKDIGQMSDGELKETKNTPKVNSLDHPIPIAPTSSAQFYAQWKELNTKQRYHYLKSIPIKQLSKILGAGFDSETFADIIHTIQNYYLPEKDVATAATLFEISTNKQMIILSLLLSADERKALIDIINTLKENQNTNPQIAQQIMENFNLN